ncbi:hypothetical protein CSKR_100267 [Clonorchis sinensis]|uniref:Uncharacterized protein n=1 Tax=Clonorchis sinensis TaxID=79923 RepID=A0A3R7FK42_CLOSI|nr:hypothetical protein CSKR_100267 [Clonorchis sinensis]
MVVVARDVNAQVDSPSAPQIQLDGHHGLDLVGTGIGETLLRLIASWRSAVVSNSAARASFAAAQSIFRRPLLAASRAAFARPLSRTIEQGSKTLICIQFTKLNIHLPLERVFLKFSGYSLTVTQIKANATNRLRQFRNRSHFSGDAKRIYGKTYYSRVSSVVSTVTP